MAVAAASLAALAWSYFASSGSTALGLEPADLNLIARGAVKGALHIDNIDNILSCLDKPMDTMENMKNAITRFSQKEISPKEIMFGVNDLGKGFKEIGAAVKDCDTKLGDRERQLFDEITSYFQTHSLTSTVSEVSKNVMVNGVDIYRELDAAYTNFLAKEYEVFGRDLGSAFTMTFIGNATLPEN